jgi:hypothetical protein
MLFLLNQAVRMVATRLDNVFLSWQLELFNARLEVRVFEKTRDLHKAHHHLLTILHGIDNYIHITDTISHRLLFANDTAKRLFGADIEGKECFRVLRQHDGVCEFCKIPQLLAAQEESQKVIAWESFNPLTGRWFLNYEKIVDWPDAQLGFILIAQQDLFLYLRVLSKNWVSPKAVIPSPQWPISENSTVRDASEISFPIYQRLSAHPHRRPEAKVGIKTPQ